MTANGGPAVPFLGPAAKDWPTTGEGGAGPSGGQQLDQWQRGAQEGAWPGGATASPPRAAASGAGSGAPLPRARQERPLAGGKAGPARVPSPASAPRPGAATGPFSQPSGRRGLAPLRRLLPRRRRRSFRTPPPAAPGRSPRASPPLPSPAWPVRGCSGPPSLGSRSLRDASPRPFPLPLLGRRAGASPGSAVGGPGSFQPGLRWFLVSEAAALAFSLTPSPLEGLIKTRVKQMA